jgi:manganese efflux pump family protein
MIGLLLLALALAADAFAVSIARGAGGQHSLGRAMETGLVFGAAQGIMPLLGWGLGALFSGWIEAFDHWIAFGLLTILGIRMLIAAFSADAEDVVEGAGTTGRAHWLALGAAAIATSIDAAAAGLTLDLFGYPVWFACGVIALVTAALCVPGYWFASRIGGRYGRLAEGAGGVVLVGLGAKILLEHLG